MAQIDACELLLLQVLTCVLCCAVLCMAGEPSREIRGSVDSGGSATRGGARSSEPATLPMDVMPPNWSEDAKELRRGMPHETAPPRPPAPPSTGAPNPALLRPSARCGDSPALIHGCTSATCIHETMLFSMCSEKAHP